MIIKRETIIKRIDFYTKNAAEHLAQYNANLGAAQALEELLKSPEDISSPVDQTSEDTALKEAEKQAEKKAEKKDGESDGN